MKVKDIQYDTDLTENFFVIVSMQKSAQFTLIFKKKQILGSHKLNDHIHF